MYRRGIKLGFIKGGQLARMMLQQAPNIDVHALVMDNDPQCPARFLCQEFMLGNSDSFDDVELFGRRVDVLTFEYEHVHVGALRRLKSQGVAVYPHPDILELVQDKGKQKEFYRQQGFPTADYRLVSQRALLNTHTDFFPAIQKLCVGGYDGKGIYPINSVEDIPQAFNAPSVLEKKVDIAKEIAVIGVRNVQQQMVIYPAVEMVFHPTKHLVSFLRSPADIDPVIEKNAKDMVYQIMERLDMVGVLAVEFFIDTRGRLLINEMAPRVHNSGHHTIEANFTSQFEQHVRAVLGLPLGSTEAHHAAAMVNILGEEGYDGVAVYEGLHEALAIDGVSVHLYGKEMTRAYRKMGHATAIDRDIQKAIAKAERVSALLKVRA